MCPHKKVNADRVKCSRLRYKYALRATHITGNYSFRFFDDTITDCPLVQFDIGHSLVISLHNGRVRDGRHQYRARF